MGEPQCFASVDHQHFDQAYRRGPLLLAIVTRLLGLPAAVPSIPGQFLKGLGALILAAVAFAFPGVDPQLALTNPS